MRTGVGISSVGSHQSSLLFLSHRHQVLPLVIPLAYYLLLPKPARFAALPIPSADEEDFVRSGVAAEYTPLPTDDDDVPVVAKSPTALSVGDKWHLVKPLLMRYMLPLCTHLSSGSEYSLN